MLMSKKEDPQMEMYMFKVLIACVVSSADYPPPNCSLYGVEIDRQSMYTMANLDGEISTGSQGQEYAAPHIYLLFLSLALYL